MNYVTPIGFRDVISDEALVREDLTYRVQQCFARHGYSPIETPTLEVLDVMEAGGHVPASPFKLFDSRGDLLAMRPDVTMQIARMCATRITSFDPAVKLRYTQRVFREKTAEAAARELTQMGVECLGESGVEADANIIALFSEALAETRISEYRIALGSARVLRDLVSCCQMDAGWENAVYRAFHTSNFVVLDNLTKTTEGNQAAISALAQLPMLRGQKEALGEIRALLAPLGCSEGVDELEALYDLLVERGLGEVVLIDFTVMSSFDYYTGIGVRSLRTRSWLSYRRRWSLRQLGRGLWRYESSCRRFQLLPRTGDGSLRSRKSRRSAPLAYRGSQRFAQRRCDRSA